MLSRPCCSPGPAARWQGEYGLMLFVVKQRKWIFLTRVPQVPESFPLTCFANQASQLGAALPNSSISNLGLCRVLEGL